MYSKWDGKSENNAKDELTGAEPGSGKTKIEIGEWYRYLRQEVFVKFQKQQNCSRKSAKKLGQNYKSVQQYKSMFYTISF